MSFNRRGGPDRRPDRPGSQGGYPPRDRGPREGGDRPFSPRPRFDRPRDEGGDRPFSPRPRFDRPRDEGGMSIRLDPRRLTALKQLAGEAGTRPGDLVRQWVEERIDAERAGAAGTPSIGERLGDMERRLAALESGTRPPDAEAAAAPEAVADDEVPAAQPDAPAGDDPPAPQPEAVADDEAPAATPRRRRSASAAPSGRVALHDEMIAVLAERGPMPAGELAAAIAERGRYAPPRSGKPLDAAMVSQRASNPAYRSRFRRAEGRIGLAAD